MLNVPQSKFVRFREDRYWRGSRPIVGLAPKITVRALISAEEMSVIFGGHLEYEGCADGERYLGVWGARKVSRFLRLLRERGDMPAMLHKGEMVVPQNFASGLRANGGLGGASGPTFNTHYSPTINMRDPTTLRELLQKGGAELFDAVQRGYRLGLPMRPSMSTW